MTSRHVIRLGVQPRIEIVGDPHPNSPIWQRILCPGETILHGWIKPGEECYYFSFAGTNYRVPVEDVEFLNSIGGEEAQNG